MEIALSWPDQKWHRKRYILQTGVSLGPLLFKKACGRLNMMSCETVSRGSGWCRSHMGCLSE